MPCTGLACGLCGSNTSLCDESLTPCQPSNGFKTYTRFARIIGQGGTNWVWSTIVVIRGWPMTMYLLFSPFWILGKSLMVLTFPWTYFTSKQASVKNIILNKLSRCWSLVRPVAAPKWLNCSSNLVELFLYKDC